MRQAVGARSRCSLASPSRPAHHHRLSHHRCRLCRKNSTASAPTRAAPSFILCRARQFLRAGMSPDMPPPFFLLTSTPLPFRAGGWLEKISFSWSRLWRSPLLEGGALGIASLPLSRLWLPRSNGWAAPPRLCCVERECLNDPACVQQAVHNRGRVGQSWPRRLCVHSGLHSERNTRASATAPGPGNALVHPTAQGPISSPTSRRQWT